MTNVHPPVWKMTDKELIAELQKRADQQVTLDGLIKLRRMFQISAEKAPDLAPGLHMAIGLLDMQAMNYGGAAREIDVTGLLRESRKIVAAPPPKPSPFMYGSSAPKEFDSNPEMPAPRRDGRRGRKPGTHNANSQSSRIKGYVTTIESGSVIAVQDLMPLFPGTLYQTIYRVLNLMVDEGTLRREGKAWVREMRIAA